LILIAVGPAILFDTACSTLRGQFDRNREVIALLIGAVTQAACVTVVVLLTWDARAPVWGLTIAYVLLALSTLAYFRKRFAAAWQPEQLWQTYQSGQVLSILTLASPLWVSDILDIVINQADQLIVQGRLGYNALAEYAAALTFIGLSEQPITILSRVSLVTFASGFYNEFEQYKQVTSLNLFFFTVLSLGVVALCAPLTPVLFTSAYTLVPLLVMILSTSCVMHSVEVINSSLTIAQDYPQANRNAKIWITVLYIPLAIFLVSSFGVYGAAWSNVAVWTGYALIHALYMRKRLPLHAQHTFRSLLLGSVLYFGVIGAVWLLKSSWWALPAIPVYLGLGQLLGLWDLVKIVQLARRLLPGRFVLGQTGDSESTGGSERS
jgi:O-antigen/teichoic acid export membrane protein